MRSTQTVILGGGVTGLAVANLLGPGADTVLLEREAELGGYCRSVHEAGFVWDYSGHFFHFREPRVEAWLRARMTGERVRTIERRSFIWYAGRYVDFPFQKNIHQLPPAEHAECLADLRAAAESTGPEPTGFEQMLRARYGRAIAEKFLIPYNEKLYATPLDRLDVDAMGRFFPHVTLAQVLANAERPEGTGYNQTFTYPEQGAQSYVRALSSGISSHALHLSEAATAIDLARREVHTARGTYRFERLVSTVPFPKLLGLLGRSAEADALGWNQVQVFNLGFDRKGPRGVHWLYFPQRELPFYRVGFYDNIFDAERMSLYVELGFDRHARPDPAALLPSVLDGLHRAGIVTDQRLVASHSVLLDPAYVHIDRPSQALVARTRAELAAHGVFSLGRYGRWTYCSIEDNLLEAEAWALAHGAPHGFSPG